MSTCKFINSNATISSFSSSKKHELLEDIYIDFRIDEKLYRLYLKAGYLTDGLSIPSIFTWYLPTWDKKNIVYNLAGVVHDALYCIKANCLFNRETADDVLRGILRDSGISRRKAGMADKCVELFGKKHWGDDNYKIRDKILFSEWYYMN